jgi:hypothetical protein
MIAKRFAAGMPKWSTKSKRVRARILAGDTQNCYTGNSSDTKKTSVQNAELPYLVHFQGHYPGH